MSFVISMSDTNKIFPTWRVLTENCQSEHAQDEDLITAESHHDFSNHLHWRNEDNQEQMKTRKSVHRDGVNLIQTRN